MFLTSHTNNSILDIVVHLRPRELECSRWHLHKAPRPLLWLFECGDTFFCKSKKRCERFEQTRALWNTIKLVYPTSWTIKTVTSCRLSARTHPWRGEVFLEWIWSPNLCRHFQYRLTLFQNVSLHSNSDSGVLVLCDGTKPTIRATVPLNET